MTRILTIIAFLFATPAWAVTPEECSEKGLFFDIEIKKVMRGSLGTKKVERPFCSKKEPIESRALQNYYSRTKIKNETKPGISEQEEHCRAQGKSLVSSSNRRAPGSPKKQIALCSEDLKAFVRTLCLNQFEETDPAFLKCSALLSKNADVSKSHLYHTSGPNYAVHTGYLGLSLLATAALNAGEKPCNVRERGNSVITLDGSAETFRHVCQVDGKEVRIKY